MTSSRKPNILFLLNDHQAYYRHGWDCGPLVARPHFERLAREGAHFERAYTSSPLCSPARRSLLTGVLPHRHGEIKNDTNHPFDITTYLDILADAGYRMRYYGKWHAGPGTAADHGCEGISYPSYNNPYIQDEYKAYIQANKLPEPKISIEHSFDRKELKLDAAGYYHQDGPWCNEHASGTMVTPNDTHEAFYLANMACQELRAIADGGSSQPFVMSINFWGPHQPYFPTREYADLYKPQTIPVYGTFDDDLAGKPDVYWSENNRGISHDGRLIVPNPLPWQDWQQVLARCYAQITLTDAAGGRILDELERLGLAENTLVVWSTDHGDAIASHGGHFDKRSYMPEEMIRIPLAMRFPGHVRAGQYRRELVGHIDIGPTILDACGLAYPHESDGTSLLKLLGGAPQDSEWRSDLMCETHGHAEDVLGRALVAGRYKYVDYGSSGDELYDLVTDPYELHNLARDPQGHQAILTELRERLDLWRSRTNDKSAQA